MNPYEPPQAESLDFTRRGVTLMPRPLATHTSKVVYRFGLFQFTWPLAVAYWTDSLPIDIWALFIASNGLSVRPSAFRRLPWTALMCLVYPIALIAAFAEYDPLDIGNWVPSRFSPVFSLQLFSSAWAFYAVVCILRCHFAHQRKELPTHNAF
ncbi:hypothetical protein [Aporhodopirellula aestuarii]|uniref:Transmembrane protein n=1 Tax=Aporhodopirellula aestuarii TaxID=2950107 RepID=A0ABT0U334_9BACT|nr:hypothetical protein [Aporhodopirellula aestuarii]MCM2371006.1 hypothetical protein [Aporhodopirellula aestuarii]